MACQDCNKNIFKQAQNILEGTSNILFPTDESRTLAEPRIRICLECKNSKELLKVNGKSVNQCTLCKCIIQIKTTVQDEKCPIDKW